MKSSLVVGITLLAALALAKPGDLPTVASFTGTVKMMREDKWSVPKEGDAIRPDDVLDLAEAAHLEVTLPDGKGVVFDGPLIMAGRRLAGGADKVKWISRALDKLPTASVSYALEPHSGTMKAGTPVPHSTDMFWGEETPVPRSPADLDVSIAQGDYVIAKQHAEAILADKASTPTDKRKAHLALGEIALAARDFPAALEALATAGAAPGKAGDVALGVRVRALLERARLSVQLADDKTAEADLRSVTSIAPRSPHAAEARLLLGMIKLSQSDRAAAIEEFRLIGDDPYLMNAADEMLSAAP